MFVVVPHDEAKPLRDFVVPRSHVAAAAWISHMDWLNDPTVAAGQRNAPVDRSRVRLRVFEEYEARWDLLHIDESHAPVLLPPEFRGYAIEERVGQPEGHPWRESLPTW